MDDDRISEEEGTDFLCLTTHSQGYHICSRMLHSFLQRGDKKLLMVGASRASRERERRNKKHSCVSDSFIDREDMNGNSPY